VSKDVKVIAIYLPQFHPIKENDEWWGKGFTEWTNVGKAKPLFKGHYQPRVPADLGYYDLRISEVREAQAAMAREHGVYGFCYWHYWFGNGKRLLERPFNEVLTSGKPDFPFCLGWANHTWEDKSFNKEGTSKILIKQEYPGDADYKLHFDTLLPAFKDERYIKIDGKPLFHIFAPKDLPDAKYFIDFWNKLARENGLGEFHFMTQAFTTEDMYLLLEKGFNSVNMVRLFDVFKNEFSLIERAFVKGFRLLFGQGRILDYGRSMKYFIGKEDKENYCFPSIFPNWDHSPRSGRKGHIFHNSNPKLFKAHVKDVLELVKDKPDNCSYIFLRSWNEWAEGNYMEPDLRFGKGYLRALKEALDDFKK
jgi:lipopolysaccharide biosynthesis protein